MGQRKKKSDEAYCSSCGKIIKKEAEICPKCGVRQKSHHASTGGEKSKIVAGLLGIFLGGFGLHKFYLGNIGMGILYLCFCWTFIPAIVGFIEGIIYLTMTDAAFKAKYG
jgi:TM2 domain-containing membrane protein YozV